VQAQLLEAQAHNSAMMLRLREVDERLKRQV
jgi:hypothetical protein